MWKLISTEKYERRKKRFTKKKDEIEVLKALLANLKSLENILNYGKRINEIKFGWLHKETRGILAITEKGGHQEIKLSKIKAGRLYIYPDEEKKILYLLTIGDKNSQENDIKECVSLLNKLGKKMAEYKNVIDLIQKSDLDRNIKKDILTELNNRKSAEFLSLVRNYENLSEEEIAKRMGVSVDYIFKLETSTDDKITIQDLKNYAKALKANFSIQFSKKVNLVEQFIYHKNQIEKISKEMVKLVQNDPTLDNHISQFFHKQIDKMFEMFSKVTKELEHIKIQKVTPPKETLQYDYSIEKEETTEKS